MKTRHHLQAAQNRHQPSPGAATLASAPVIATQRASAVRHFAAALVPHKQTNLELIQQGVAGYRSLHPVCGAAATVTAALVYSD